MARSRSPKAAGAQLRFAQAIVGTLSMEARGRSARRLKKGPKESQGQGQDCRPDPAQPQAEVDDDEDEDEDPLTGLIRALILCHAERWSEAETILARHALRQLGGFSRTLADTLRAYCAFGLRQELQTIDRIGL